MWYKLKVCWRPLTLIQPGKGRFTLAYMSHDYLHGSHAGLPGWIRVKILYTKQQPATEISLLLSSSPDNVFCHGLKKF